MTMIEGLFIQLFLGICRQPVSSFIVPVTTRESHTFTNSLTFRTTGESGSGKSEAVKGSCFGFEPDAVG